MTTAPTPSELAHLDDEELDRLVARWRAQAGRGDREAFGIAHLLEVERRRRVRDSRLQQLDKPVAAPRPWWQWWRREDGAGPLSPF